MSTSIFTTYNNSRGSIEDRKNHYKNLKALSEKNAKRTAIIFPNGEEKVFDSAMAACRFLKVSSTVVSGWLKNGGPKRGKFKGYSAKLVN